MFGHASFLPASAVPDAAGSAALTDHPAGLLAVLLAVLAGIFWLARHPVFGRLFKVVPSLVFCYFVPTALTTAGVIPSESPLYEWVKSFLLPAALMLLVLSLDVPGILRLGPKAVIMFLAGTAGVLLGGPIALLVTGPWLPADAWRGMSALAGSWIGGGANFVAIGQAAEVSDTLLATMVIPDVFVANIWMGVLLYLSAHQDRIDDWSGADPRAIRELERRMTDFQERTNRVATLADLMLIVALGFGGAWVSYVLGLWLAEGLAAVPGLCWLSDALSASTWKFIIVTTLGVALSFTRARGLEGAGASKIGSVMIYLLVACLGASADFRLILQAPALIVMGLVWISVHIVVLFGIGRLIRAPIFLIAVGSQANIGGAASAPVLAAAFHPALAPVGALLAVAGYVLGTYGGLVCMQLLKWVAHAD